MKFVYVMRCRETKDVYAVRSFPSIPAKREDIAIARMFDAIDIELDPYGIEFLRMDHQRGPEGGVQVVHHAAGGWRNFDGRSVNDYYDLQRSDVHAAYEDRFLI